MLSKKITPKYFSEVLEGAVRIVQGTAVSPVDT